MRNVLLPLFIAVSACSSSPTVPTTVVQYRLAQFNDQSVPVLWATPGSTIKGGSLTLDRGVMQVSWADSIKISVQAPPTPVDTNYSVQQITTDSLTFGRGGYIVTRGDSLWLGPSYVVVGIRLYLRR